jgi:uncharacterized protein YeaO (DUF488 family)
MIRLKRAYKKSSRGDGFRILVERLWPRGISKQNARIDLWLKDIAPSPELRKWYSHDIKKWKEFRQRYEEELRDNRVVSKLKELLSEKRRLTFIYAARDEEHNSAVVLKEYIETN